MNIIDTHCHLVSEKLRENLPELLENAKAAGVHKILNIAYSPETIALACKQVQQSEMLYAAIGIQPHDASSYTPEVAEDIRNMASKNAKVVAIGEIGLDDFHTLSPMPQQEKCFEHFLSIACDLKLPVVVHVRETHRAVAERISHYSKLGLTGVIHCFTGTQEEAKEFLDCGFYISFSGIVTFKNSIGLKEVAKYVPAERILVETDSPYLAPIPMRGKTNEPAWVKHVLAHVAELRQVPLEGFAQQTTQNALALFKGMA